MKYKYKIIKCSECDGTGKINNNKCTNCNGKGEIKIITEEFRKEKI